MRRWLTAGGFLALGLVLVVLSFVFRSDRTAHENMVRDREQTRIQDPSQTLNRGRIGAEASVHSAPQTWTGILVDAGCPDRTHIAMHTAPDTSVPSQAQTGSADRVNGIMVNPETVRRERGDAMAHQVPDLATRQMDAGCAVTGGTRGFAVYLPNGESKDLDEGGNTKAMELFQATPEGQAVMNGHARGAKPKVTVTGRMSGDTIIVQAVRFLDRRS